MYLKPELAAFLQNNDVHSESAMLEVTESLKAPLSELQKVEAEIQRLGELMETMKMKGQNIQKIINDYNIILSPVRRLPADVLHEIFFHCLPTLHNPIVKYSESPLLLTRICSSWRAIALTSPRIWSKVHIPLLGDPSVSDGIDDIITEETRLSDRRRRFAGVMRSRCDTVRSWLSRSGTCPLSLSVTCPRDNSGMQNSKDDSELNHEMFDILRSFADRWSVVSLSIPEEFYNKLQGDRHPTIFPSLKSLKIILYRKDHLINTRSIPIYTPIRLLAGPALRRISVHATSPMIWGLEYQSMWDHITHITTSTIDRDLIILLRQCPNLVFGNFVVYPPQLLYRKLEDKDSLELLLPRLESLAINDSGTHETMVIIFEAIKAPALTRLLYQCYPPPRRDSTVPFPVTPVIPLLENSTLISTLSLDGGLSSQDTYECLQRGAQVTRIVFGRPPIPFTFSGVPPLRALNNPDVIRQDHFDLKILSIGSVEMTLLPRLEFVEAYYLSSLTDEDLLDMITSRIHASQRGEVAALKSVKMLFQRHRQKDITEDVSRLAKEAGIEVELELTYAAESAISLDRLSPSFGLTLNEGMLP